METVCQHLHTFHFTSSNFVSSYPLQTLLALTHTCPLAILQCKEVVLVAGSATVDERHARALGGVIEEAPQTVPARAKIHAQRAHLRVRHTVRAAHGGLGVGPAMAPEAGRAGVEQATLLGFSAQELRWPRSTRIVQLFKRISTAVLHRHQRLHVHVPENMHKIPKRQPHTQNVSHKHTINTRAQSLTAPFRT